MKNHITVTVCLENSLWVALFETVHYDKLRVSRVIFGKEPTDPELYQWLIENYDQLNFSSPQDFKLIVKRKNPKRMLREVKKEMEKASTSHKESFAQEALRLELEKRKKIKKSKSTAEKEAEKEKRFLQAQEKKKQKKRGR